MGWRRAHIIIVIIIIILLAVEIGGTFMFICASVLRDMSAEKFGLREAWGLAYKVVTLQNLPNITRRVLV